MNYSLIEEMEKTLNENNLAKARSILINSLLTSEDAETIDRLNKMAIENGVFEDDNGEYSNSKNDEEKSKIITMFQASKKWDTKRKVAAAATVGMAVLAIGVKLLGKRKSNKK